MQHVLSLANPPLELVGPPDVTPELARIANDSLADLCAKYPDHFPAFIAALPMNNIDATLAEIDRAIKYLGARGVQVFTNVAGKPLSRQEFRPVLRRMARVAIDATSKQALDLIARYRAQLEHGRMMFLFCEEDYRRGYESKSLEKVLAQLSPEHRARCTRLIIPGRSLQELELSTQDDLIRTITDWAAELFSERPSPIVV